MFIIMFKLLEKSKKGKSKNITKKKYEEKKHPIQVAVNKKKDDKGDNSCRNCRRCNRMFY
jgi:polyferredoxin